MSERFECGLVVGKFCPLHLGHEWLIEQARRQCHQVIVLSYTDLALPGYDSAVRERWLQARFGSLDIQVIDHDRLQRMGLERGLGDIPAIPPDAADADEHRHFVAWLCLNLFRRKVDAVFTSEDYGDGFAAVLAQRFETPVTHVCVDRARKAVPISGSAIRADLWANHQYLSPVVRASFVKRIALLGAESSGKSTLARHLAARLQTHHVDEYGRTLWEARQGALVYDDLLHIAQTQVSNEEVVAQHAREWLVCDTSPLTTLFYCETLFGRASAELHRLAQRRYDCVVLCLPDFPFVQDGTRQDTRFQQRQHHWYVQQLRERQIPYIEAAGSVSKRVEKIVSALQR